MKYIIFFVLCLLLASCEPGYRIYIYNNSPSDAYLKTRPSVETGYSNPSHYRDSIVKFKVSQENGFSTYQIRQNGKFRIHDNIGGPSVRELPYDWIELTNAKDTIILNSKEKIYQRLVRVGNAKKKGRGGTYYIEISK